MSHVAFLLVNERNPYFSRQRLCSTRVFDWENVSSASSHQSVNLRVCFISRCELISTS